MQLLNVQLHWDLHPLWRHRGGFGAITVMSWSGVSCLCEQWGKAPAQCSLDHLLGLFPGSAAVVSADRSITWPDCLSWLCASCCDDASCLFSADLFVRDQGRPDLCVGVEQDYSGFWNLTSYLRGISLRWRDAGRLLLQRNKCANLKCQCVLSFESNTSNVFVAFKTWSWDTR